MNKKIILRAMAAIALLLAVSINVEAQSVLQRARNAAGNAVQSTTDQTKQGAEQKAGQTVSNATGQTSGETAPATGQQSSGGQPAPKNLKPSAAAIAADPLASDNNVANGFSRSPAQIRAGYEALNPKVYFMPYYHPQVRNYWLLESSQYQYFTISCLMLDEHRRAINQNSFLVNRDSKPEISINYGGIPGQYYIFITDTVPVGTREVYREATGQLPIGIHAMYAGMALFAADPDGYFPMMKYVEARLAYMGAGHIYLSPSPPNNAWDQITVVMNPQKELGKLPLEWGKYLNSDLNMEIRRLDNIAMGETPIEVVKSAAAYYYNNARKFEDNKNNYGLLRYNFHLFEIAMYFWTHSSKKVADPDFETLYNEYRRLETYYKDWVKLEAEGGAAVDMPKTYDMGATLAAKALAAAKKQFSGSFNVDKVVFLSNTWKEFKEPNYPYRVMHRSLDAGLLTNSNGNWMIRYYNFQQASDQKGGWTENYGFTAGGSGSNAQRVNYKP